MGCVVGLLSIAPPLPFSIPVIINSNLWLYGFFVVSFLGMMLLFKEIPCSFKILIPYMFFGCFISMIPYASFNAFILVVISAYCFLLFLKSDDDIVIEFIVMAFMFQIFLGIMQMFGVDKLLNFNRSNPVFVGSVLQYMRFGTLLAIMAPFLVFKDKRFIVPVVLVAILTRSSSFGLGVILAIGVYYLLLHAKYRLRIIGFIVIALIGYVIWDFASIQIACTDGRIPVWLDIIRTWIWDTSRCKIPVARNYIYCLIDWKSIFFGRGLDSFLYLFPIFKQDPNPFPQAHNDFLQMYWEIGLIGGSIFVGYCVNLVRRLYRTKNFLLIAGAVCIGTNMFFAFPMRMVQTMLLLIYFVALCEKEIKNGCNQAHDL